MTPSNAELREAIERLILKDKPVQYVNTADLTKTIDDLTALVQAREQQILTELLSHKSVITLSIYGTNNCEALEIIPVSVIERLQNKTNDGGTE